MSFTQFLQDDPLYSREQIMGIAIQVADELDMPDRRGAAVIAGLAISTEVGVEDNDPPHERRFWCPANHADEESFQYPHDSISNDGRSVGVLQQQKGPRGALWWGPTSSEMDPRSAITEFMKRLKKRGYDASNARSAGEAAQGVQQSAFPDRYADKWNDINGLYDKVAGNGEPATPKPTSAAPFPEHNIINGQSCSSRNGRKPRLFVLHTEEGNMLGQPLKAWMDNNNVGYHYAVDPDGTAWDLTDTDLASWSVLDANSYTINLVFAGSFAGQTRNEWLSKFGNAIKQAAYLCAQDCHKYNIPPVVRVGGSASGYPSLPTNDGVTDHYGITVGLKIGNHTDVGKGFPWDTFSTYLTQFYNGLQEEDDMFSDEDRALLRTVHDELTKRFPSRSIYRSPGEGLVDTLAGFELNVDAAVHADLVEEMAKRGDEDSINRILRTAAGEGEAKDEWAVNRAKSAIEEWPQEVKDAYMGDK